MEAWMKMSRFTLNAADHTRGVEAIRGFAPCALHLSVEVAREPVISLSVVTTKLSMRSLNPCLTVNK